MVAQTYYVNETMDVEAVSGSNPTKPKSPHRSKSCWSRRTSLEKILLCALVLLTLFAIALAVFGVLLAMNLARRTSDSKDSVEKVHWAESGARSSGNTSVPMTGWKNQTDPERTLANKTDPGDMICNTHECIRTAYRMIENMDLEADPCRNFHEYACGGWLKRNAATDKLSYSIFSDELVHKVDSHLKTLLENDDYPDDEPAAFQKTREFYSSCMLVAAINQRGFRPAKTLLDTIGKIYDNETWTEGAVDLTDLIYQLLLRNGAPFFEVGLEESNENSSQQIITVGLPSHSEIIQSYKHTQDLRHEIAQSVLNGPSGLHVSNLIDAEEENATDSDYGEFFHLLETLNVTVDGNLIYRHMKISLDHKMDEKMYKMLRTYFQRPDTDPRQKAIEKELEAFITDLRDLVPLPKQLKLAEQRDETSKTYAIGNLQELLKQINWKLLLGKLFRRTFHDEEMVEVAYSPYLKELQKLFEKYDQRTINNAALAIFARDVLWELINTNKDDNERWEFCVEATKKVLPTALSAMYVRDFNKADLRTTQNDVKEMFDHFKKSFLQRIEEIEWLDDQSKDGTRRKVENMTGFFVNSDNLYNNTYIAESLKNITIEEHRFFENVVSSYVQSRLEAYNMNNSHVDSASIEKNALASPFVVNAYYLPGFNKILLTLAILTPPYYVGNQPKYITYGSLGNTIGHEITHGFDTTGIKYDFKGQKKSWLTSSSREKFHDRNQCFIEMYKNTFEQEVEFLDQEISIKFDGNFTLDENLADNSGINLAYLAYQSWTAEHGRETLLPGLQHSQEQLFFLSAAQSSCTIMAPMAYIFSLELDDHTPEPERVNGFLMNSKSFAEAFHCPVGSPMNPASKCDLW